MTWNEYFSIQNLICFPYPADSTNAHISCANITRCSIKHSVSPRDYDSVFCVCAVQLTRFRYMQTFSKFKCLSICFGSLTKQYIIMTIKFFISLISPPYANNALVIFFHWQHLPPPIPNFSNINSTQVMGVVGIALYVLLQSPLHQPITSTANIARENKCYYIIGYSKQIQ